jgi:DNA-binding transcriptional LysR family regulator
MDRLEAMAIFVAVVDAGSLARAADKLGRSPATVSRALMLLEQRSGERLMHRSARKLQLTEGGERRLVAYRSILAELNDLEGSSKPKTALAGWLRVTAPELFGRMQVMPIIERFLAKHPGARARVLLLNRVVDLVDEGMDVAVRLAPLPDSGIIGVRLGEVRRLVCASPAYVDRAGWPKTPAELAQHVCIGQYEGNERELWRFANRSASRGRAASIAVHPHIALNSAGAAVDAALRGSGICRPLSYQVVDHIAARRLVPLLAAYEPPPVPVHLLFHAIPRRNVLLRTFVDEASAKLRAELAAIAAKMAGRGVKSRG